MCDDLGWVTRSVPVGHPDFGKAFPCQCQAPKIAQARVERCIEDSGILSRYREMTFGTFVDWCYGDLSGKELGYEVATQMAGSATWPDIDGRQLPGLTLWGDYGTGKSGLASLITIEWARAGRSTLAIDWQDFVQQIRDTYDRKKGELSRHQLIVAAASVDLLLIDELGKVRLGADGTRTVEKVTSHNIGITEELIRIRHAHERSTLITTNLYPAELRQTFARYLFERLGEMSHWVEIGGAPMRLQE